MTLIADTLKNKDYFVAIDQAQEEAVLVDNDYKNETTSYTFVDESVLTDCNGELSFNFNKESASYTSNAQKSQEQINYELEKMFS